MGGLAEDISSYEDWLRQRCAVVEADLDHKHARMRESAFDFLRASYFRWAATIEQVCPGFAGAPRALCVGDTHVENFGTWRDGDGRLVWGVNDFDEAATMPYPYDLIRLATSARLAPALRVDGRRAAGAILRGYFEGLARPRPALLDEDARWLRALVAAGPGAAADFWRKLDRCPDADPPRAVRRALRRSLPEGALVLRYAARRRGSGSLGRPRYLVVAQWQGGRVVREAKAMVPSAWRWAHPRGKGRNRFLELAFGAHRSPDPLLKIKAGFLLRRLAADARKVELEDVARRGLDARLLAAMGADIGAIHAGHRGRGRILEDVRKRHPDWLHLAAERAEAALRADFAALPG